MSDPKISTELRDLLRFMVRGLLSNDLTPEEHGDWCWNAMLLFGSLCFPVGIVLGLILALIFA